jgi:hypothetical protein
LEYGVFSLIVNLDPFNLVLQGLHNYSTLKIWSGIFLLQDLSWMFCRLITDVVSLYFFKQPKKPPDIDHQHQDPLVDTVFVACSSTYNKTLDDKGCYTESFDSEDTFMVRLDSLSSYHLFPRKSNFVFKTTLIDPYGIQGVGGDICFHCDKGILHDKLIKNMYYAPRCLVCLISIPQLARDTNESSTLCTGGASSIFTWEDNQVTVKHPSPLEVPFMTAYLGDPTYSALCSLCALAQNPFSRDTQDEPLPLPSSNKHHFT